MKPARRRPNSGTRARSACVSVAVLVLGILAGCNSKQTGQDETIFQQSQQLFERYLEADAATAERSLEEEIQLLENAKVPLYLPRQATVLFTECVRLYVLEEKLGHGPKADLALVKARYWNLRRFEVDGALTDQKLEELKSFAPEKLAEIVDKSDKEHTKGKGAKYARRE